MSSKLMEKARKMLGSVISGINFKRNKITTFDRKAIFDNIKGGAKKCANSPYFREVKSLWAQVKSSVIMSAVTAAVAISICGTVNLFDLTIGFEVIVDGENIGMVTDRSMVSRAVDNVHSYLDGYFGEEYNYSKEPVFIRRVVTRGELADMEQLQEALLANVDTMVEAYSVYVDGKAVFGVSSEDAAAWVFNKYKQKYVGEEITDDMAVDFCEEVEVKKEFIHIALLKTPEDALDELSGNEKAVAAYTVKSNDTLWDIAEKYDTTVEHILAMNDHITDNIREGMSIKVEEAVPLLSVRTVQTVSLDESIPYTVEKINDDTIYQGRTVVSQKGKDGSARVLAKVTKINGDVVEKNVLETEVLSEPVKQVEKIGTKELPPTTGSGTFIKPTYGTLSSRYGSRWNRNHNGIDIAGSYNTPIKAADGGLVTYAGWMSGYGNYVVIDHENGYQTAYGHCASLSVKVGDRVTKGQQIAKMGNTGRSTGTHLHFEVKKNGQYVDPTKYIGY